MGARRKKRREEAKEQGREATEGSEGCGAAGRGGTRRREAAGRSPTVSATKPCAPPPPANR
eukprot:11267-Rhodomonas_salina.1